MNQAIAKHHGISNHEKIAVTIYYLGHGGRYRGNKMLFMIPHNTMSGIVKEVCQAIVEEYSAEAVKIPTKTAEWEEVAHGFMEYATLYRCH